MGNLKKILATIAPFLGSLIGGPFGAAAGKLLGNLLLGNENASIEEIEQALSGASPEQLVKLKELDNDYKIKMAELGFNEQKIAALDRDSARNREVKIKDKIPAVLAVMLTLGFFGILAALMIYSIPAGTKDVVQIMLGSLGTAWIAAITYYFGSSYGSTIKTRMLEHR